MVLSPAVREFAVVLLVVATSSLQAEEPLRLELRQQFEEKLGGGIWRTHHRNESWPPGETAIIVCDMWDLHHCLNAVRRLEQFAPRLNEVLKEARDRGVTIIHSPSDCMDSYAGHPARRRAVSAPPATRLPYDIQSWCSRIPAEERGSYPVDQSDGGEDDDPLEHQEWVEELRKMGRNPGMPWKKQSDLIEIDEGSDFISDQGDEVWNVLEHRGIQNVILTGVHLNMCVLGRPFGLRQLVRNGKHVVLMRDMTDTMYNPLRWPYVSHQQGTELVVQHVERFVCPTITSNQIIGGDPFELMPVGVTSRLPQASGESITNSNEEHWVTVHLPHTSSKEPAAWLNDRSNSRWYRCVVRLPAEWTTSDLALTLESDTPEQEWDVWINGHKTTREAASREHRLPQELVLGDDFNLVVIRVPPSHPTLTTAPLLTARENAIRLEGGWQFRAGEDPAFSNMPLPAKFGGCTDIIHSPPEPQFVARALTTPGQFTKGIEGPACDAEGNVLVVNFQEQGTIGRVSPRGGCELFVKLPEGSIGNGIRFGASGDFFVADYTQHNVLRVNTESRHVTVLAHNPEMNQPNDLAIDEEGTLFASDPNWQAGTGQIWRIDKDGTTTRLASGMGTTNGIEVSPDGETLYVNESVQRCIWSFRINADKTLSDKRLLRKFDDYGFDGMRCDVDGNLYVTRHGKGTIVKLSPGGEVLREIVIPGTRPTNLCFGGVDGCTVYVTEVDFTRLVHFRVDRPGLAWSRR